MSLKQSLIVSEYQFTALVSEGQKQMKFPCQYMLTWKCGMEKASGSKSIPSQENGIMIFEDQLKINVKISQNPSTGEYERKKSMIYLNLKTENHPEFREIGHVVVELGEFANNPNNDEYKEYSFEKDKDSKLKINIKCQKLRDVNPIGYTPQHQRSSSLFNTPQHQRELQNSRFSQRGSNNRSQSFKIKQEQNVIQKLSQQLELSNLKNKQQEKQIFNLKMIEQQLVMNQIDLQAKIQQLTDKNISDQLKISQLDLRMEDLVDIQSQLQNLKWENNQLKSELQTAKKINQVRESMISNISMQSSRQGQQTQNQRFLKERLFNIESECTTLLHTIKQRQQGRQQIQQRFLITEEECKNLNILLQQKDLQVLSLRQQIQSIHQNQFNTPIKTEQQTVQTNQMGIQYSDLNKSEDRKQYRTPQPKKSEQQQLYSKQLKNLRLQIDLKNNQINRLLDNIKNIQQHKIINMQKQKIIHNNLKQLQITNKQLNQQIEYLNKQLNNQQEIIQNYQQTKTDEASFAKSQQIIKQKIHMMQQQAKSLQGYIKTLEQQNNTLSIQNQNLILQAEAFKQLKQVNEFRQTKQIKQTKQAIVDTEQLNQRQQQKQYKPQQPYTPTRQKTISLESNSIQKSRIKQLRSLVQNLQQQNRFIISKAKQEEEENNKLRSKLHQSERVIESLKKEISLDIQDIDLVRKELDKQKQINENIDSHLLAEKNIVERLTQKLVKTQQQYDHVSKQLQQLQLRRSRKRDRREQSRAKYQNQIKALSDEVIRLHQELFRMRMMQQMRQTNQQDKKTDIVSKDQISLSRNLFNEKGEHNQMNILIQQIRNLNQLFQSLPTIQTTQTLSQYLTKNIKSMNMNISNQLKFKQLINSKLREINSSLQKLKTIRNISLQERRKIVNQIHPIEECITNIMELQYTHL